MTGGNGDDMPDDGWISTWAEKPDWNQIWESYRAAHQREQLEILEFAVRLAGAKLAQEGNEPRLFEELAQEIQALRSGNRNTVFTDKRLPPLKKTTVRPFHLSQAYLAAAVEAYKAHLAEIGKMAPDAGFNKPTTENAIEWVVCETGQTFEQVEQAYKDCHRTPGTKNYYTARSELFNKLVSSLSDKSVRDDGSDSMVYLPYAQFLCRKSAVGGKKASAP